MMRPSAPLGVVPLDARHHAVAVQRFLHVDGGDVDVGLARAVAGFSGTTNPKPAGLQVSRPTTRFMRCGQPDARAADADHGALVEQPPQHRLQLAAVRPAQAQAAHQVTDRHRLPLRSQQREDLPGEAGGRS